MTGQARVCVQYMVSRMTHAGDTLAYKTLFVRMASAKAALKPQVIGSEAYKALYS